MRKCIKEVIGVIEKENGKIREEKMPMITGSHPELDESKFLDEE